MMCAASARAFFGALAFDEKGSAAGLREGQCDGHEGHEATDGARGDHVEAPALHREELLGALGEHGHVGEPERGGDGREERGLLCVASTSVTRRSGLAMAMGIAGTPPPEPMSMMGASAGRSARRGDVS